MRIVNFNRRDKADKTKLLDTYIDWNKQYCYDLNRKITSLYDYMIWNYPEYLIFNAPTSLSGKDDFEPYKSLAYSSIEPRLVQPYEQYVDIMIGDSVQTKSVFFPSRLNFHQGFYNQSIYGDAYLVQLVVVSSQNMYKILGENSYLVNISYNTDDVDCFIWTKLHFEPQKNAIWLTKASDILYGYSNLSNKWERWTKDSEYELLYDSDKNEYEVYIYYPDIYDMIGVRVNENTNFPSGYICILNKQSIGLNNEQNPIKSNLSNYIIAPIGNGGYYNIWWNNDVLQADYKANELNNFSNKITVNLAQNCRYINPSPDTFCFQNNKNSVTIPNWHIDNNEVIPQLTDQHKNIWTGQKDLITQTYFGGEKIFADVQYDSFLSVVKQQNVHNLNAHVEEPFSLKKVDLLIY